MKIVVAAHDDDLRISLSALLAAYDFAVHAAKVEEALEVVEAVRPAVVVVDFGRLADAATGLARQLRSDFPGVYLIGLSCLRGDATSPVACAQCVDSVVLKPDITSLLRILEARSASPPSP